MAILKRDRASLCLTVRTGLTYTIIPTTIHPDLDRMAKNNLAYRINPCFFTYKQIDGEETFKNLARMANAPDEKGIESLSQAGIFLKPRPHG